MTTRADVLYRFSSDLRDIEARAIALQRHPEGSAARAAALRDLLIEAKDLAAKARQLGLDEGRVAELDAMVNTGRENLLRSLPDLRVDAVIEVIAFADELAEDLAAL